MKIYSVEIDMNKPVQKKIWTPRFSDYKIAIKAQKNGEDVTEDVTLWEGETKIESEEDLYNGYMTFVRSSGDAGQKKLTVKVDGEWVCVVDEIANDTSSFEVGGLTQDLPNPTAIYDNADIELATQKLDSNGEIYTKNEDDTWGQSNQLVQGWNENVIIGKDAISVGNNSVAIGKNAEAIGSSSVALGYEAYVSGSNAVQLGQGVNETNNTLQYGSYQIVDGNGNIPVARLGGISTSILSGTYDDESTFSLEVFVKQ